MTSVTSDAITPPRAKTRSTKLTPEEKALRAAERAAHTEAARRERARIRAVELAGAKEARLAEAEGGHVALPAIVRRDGSATSCTEVEAWAVIEQYLPALCIDVEHSGYPIGHELYELRTVQMGGEHAAVVFDALDPRQMEIVALALALAVRLHAHSATADVIPLVVAGAIGWDEAWGKMTDSVILVKLIDPKLSGSDADALKKLSLDMLREYAVAPKAEEAKNALFKAMGCGVKVLLTTPKEKNGWYRVNRFSRVMTVYAGSDVLDLAAVLRILPPIPVSEYVIDRERGFQESCAPITWVGFALDADHIKKKIVEEEAARALALERVLILSDGRITNPKSPDVIKLLPEILPGIALGVDRKTKKPSANKASLEKLALTDVEEKGLVYHLCKQILDYRHRDTTLGLLLRQLENLCDYGDSRMRPTVYTIEASTGRTSCRRPNGQQFSRQGGVRASVVAGEMLIELVDGQWRYTNLRMGEPVPMKGISCDFEGCEIRVGAALSGDRGLLEAETSPMCWLHREIGCCDKPHKGLHWMAAHEAFGPGAVKEHRYWCKRGIFTKLFGGGPETAAEQVFAPIPAMQRVFSAFEAIAPVYTAWDQELRQLYKAGSLVWKDYATGEQHSMPIPGGNRMVYHSYSGRPIYIANGQHAAGNGAIQGTARELLVDGTARWKMTRWGRLALLPVHDQLLGFVPADEALEATQAMADCMRTTILSQPGFPVEIGAEMDDPFLSWQDSS